METTSDTTCSTTLRDCLDGDGQEMAFKHEPVADVRVSRQSIDYRLAAMQRGIIAHQALLQLLKEVGVPEQDLPSTLRDAIGKARELEIIGPKATR